MLGYLFTDETIALAENSNETLRKYHLYKKQKYINILLISRYNVVSERINKKPVTVITNLEVRLDNHGQNRGRKETLLSNNLNY